MVAASCDPAWASQTEIGNKNDTLEEAVFHCQELIFSGPGSPWAVKNLGLWLISVCAAFVPFASAVFKIAMDLASASVGLVATTQLLSHGLRRGQCSAAASATYAVIGVKTKAIDRRDCRNKENKFIKMDKKPK